MLKNLTRLDANEVVFFSRQLETIDPVNYMTLFAGLLGRRFLPAVENVSPLENVYTYRMYTINGVAPVGGGLRHAKDYPTVSITATEASQNIKQIPAAMTWAVREIQQASKYNVPLDQLTVQAAMATIGRRQDNMLAFGDSSVANIKGLLNNSLVTIDTASTKSGSGAGTKWIRAVPVNPDEILVDINTIVANTRSALHQASKMPGGDTTPAFNRFTILVSSANYAYIAATPRSANSDTTILQYALRNNPWIESIEEWWQCDLADAGGTGPRMVCYPRDPMWGGSLIPDDFTQLGPQEEGHDVVVPCNGSCGGTVIRYPVATRYQDGT